VLVLLAFGALLAAAAAADLRAFRIPNWVSAALVALFLVNGLPQHAELGWAGHLGVGGAVFAVGLVVYAFGGMGAGDVKLLAATSLWLGPSLLVPHLLATSLLGVGLMLVLLALRRWSPLPAAGEQRRRVPAALLPGKRMPYGVAIAASAAILALRLPPTLWLL
jgi:prepilin peptidase CpaA